MGACEKGAFWRDGWQLSGLAGGQRPAGSTFEYRGEGSAFFFSFCRLRFGAWAGVKNVTWHVRDQEAEKRREQAKCPISQRAAKQGTHKGK